MKRKKILKRVLIGIIVTLVILLTPKVDIIADGGTRVYRALLYKVIKYHKLDLFWEDGTIIPGRRDTVIKIFPHNLPYSSLEE